MRRTFDLSAEERLYDEAENAITKARLAGVAYHITRDYVSASPTEALLLHDLVMSWQGTGTPLLEHVVTVFGPAITHILAAEAKAEEEEAATGTTPETESAA
jgi:hypothetical protein